MNSQQRKDLGRWWVKEANRRWKANLFLLYIMKLKQLFESIFFESFFFFWFKNIKNIKSSVIPNQEEAL